MAGVAEWVCCPGEENAELIRILTNSPAVHCWHVPDERSAGGFALGRIQATSRPVAVLAGSGAGAAGLMPAVAEAYYQRRPLIVITPGAAETAEGTGAWGRIEQGGLFGLYAERTVEVQLPCSVEELPDMVALCAEGFPIHLQVNCTPGMRRGGCAAEVADPPMPPRFRGSLAEISQMLRFRAREEGLVLILGALEPTEQEAALWLARTLRVPTLAEPTSGLREQIAPLLLPPEGASELLATDPPRHVLRVGSVPSFPFWQELEQLPGTEVYSITRSGFSGLRRPSFVTEGELEQIMRALDEIPHVGDVVGLLPRARKYAARLHETLYHEPESAPALVHAFSQYASLAEVMFLGSRSASRLWSTYAQLKEPVIYTRSLSQAGGTDGLISAFLGNSAAVTTACALVEDADLLRDLTAGSLIPQLPPAKRIIAVLRSESAIPLPDPAEIARFWHAEYYPIHTEADLEIIDDLSNDTLALLDLGSAKNI